MLVAFGLRQKFALSILSLFFAVFLFGHPHVIKIVRTTDFVATQIGLSLAVIALFALSVRTFSSWRKMGGLWLIPIFALLPIVVGRSVALINNNFAQGQPQPVDAVIGDVSSHTWYQARDSLETHYEVELTFTNSNGKQQVAALEVPREMAEHLRATKGSRGQILLRSGALGFQYVSGYLSSHN